MAEARREEESPSSSVHDLKDCAALDEHQELHGQEQRGQGVVEEGFTIHSRGMKYGVRGSGPDSSCA